VSLRLLRWQVGLRLLMFLVPVSFFFFVQLIGLFFLVFYSKVCFGFAQVLLILRSQVGLMPCAKFILWSEVRFLASANWFLVLTIFSY